jgi:peptide/nickel transport system substrate-binding protein
MHSGWEDKKVNEIFEASLKEMDPVKREAQYKEIQEIYLAAPPIVPLYQSPYPVAFRKSVKGFVQIPLGNNIFVSTSVEK